MKREAADNQRKAGKWKYPGGSLIGDYPTIVEYMTDAFWDDGKPREPSSLTINIGGDQVRISLNDKPQKRSVNTTAASLEAALQALEHVLAAGSPPWRYWK